MPSRPDDSEPKAGKRVRKRDLKTWASSDEVARAAKRTRATVQLWSKQGLLPPYEVVSVGRGGRHARWPIEAVAQARYVAELFASQLTVEEVRTALSKRARGE